MPSHFRVSFCDEARPETRFVRDVEAEGPCVALELVKEMAESQYRQIRWRFEMMSAIWRPIILPPPEDYEGTPA